MNPQALKLSSPKLRVILGDPENPDSWSVLEVQTIGRDTVSAETYFGVKKIGRPIDHPVRSLVAMAYYAMVRTGKYSGPLDEFESEYVEIQPLDSDDAFPTDPGPVPG